MSTTAIATVGTVGLMAMCRMLGMTAGETLVSVGSGFGMAGFAIYLVHLAVPSGRDPPWWATWIT